jgi:putative component of membrane protein insertase Oxa1/YidC/SpoIIIJ protein YidD
MKKTIYIVISCVFLFLVMSPSAVGGETTRKPEISESDTGPVAMALSVFRKTISRADGRRCMMYPSCSHYSGQAFVKHGFVKGWVMTSDRLLRCGRDEKRLSEEIILNQQVYVFDPLQHNDFWWSRP